MDGVPPCSGGMYFVRKVAVKSAVSFPTISHVPWAGSQGIVLRGLLRQWSQCSPPLKTILCFGRGTRSNSGELGGASMSADISESPHIKSAG
jgi:hypothetical protein